MLQCLVLAKKQKGRRPVEGSQESLLRPLPVGGDDGDDGGDGNGEDRGHRDQPADTVCPAGIHVVTPGGRILNTIIKRTL